MDGLVTIRQHYRGVRPVKSYLRRKQFHGMKYLKTHPVWESQRAPEERRKYAELLYVILDTSGKGVGIEREYGVPSFEDVKRTHVFQKAKPYTRTRRGKFEHVKGSQGKEPSVVMEKLKATPSLAEYIVKRPQSHSPELVAMAKKVLGREIHGKTY